MKLIVPVAGNSSRFPHVKPKWLLTHPNGNLMFHEAISGLDLAEVDEIVVVCRDDHFRQYDLGPVIETQFAASEIQTPHRLVVIEPTRSQPETVARAIEAADLSGPVFIKDSDNYFEARVAPGDSVCTLNLNRITYTNPSNKSYAETDDRNHIINLVEKQIISDIFCVGGYSFAAAEEFIRYFRKLENDSGLYVSHVIYSMLLDGVVFDNRPVESFVDWGTLDDWERFKSQFGTLFIDVDGTLVQNSSQFFTPTWGETAGLRRNIDAVNELFASDKVRIVLTTSRQKSAAGVTTLQLDRLGIRYHDILYELPHAKRVVVNDYSRSNTYRSADAINLARDSDELDMMLKAIFAGMR